MFDRPHEIYAFQETQKQRGIAQRCHAAADIRYQENEENHDVSTLVGSMVGC